MDSQQLSDGATSETPLVTIFATLGKEFTELAQFAEELQTLLSAALLRVAHDPQCHQNIQMLDLFSQRLQALSDFITSIGQAVPPAWRIDSGGAVSAVRLSDLASRLQGRSTLEEDAQAGSLEMF
jgi:hypothetical protein